MIKEYSIFDVSWQQDYGTSSWRFYAKMDYENREKFVKIENYTPQKEVFALHTDGMYFDNQNLDDIEPFCFQIEESEWIRGGIDEFEFIGSRIKIKFNESVKPRFEFDFLVLDLEISDFEYFKRIKEAIIRSLQDDKGRPKVFNVD